MLFTQDHEGERPNGVALSLGAMTRRLAATPVSQSQGARQASGRHLETGEELALSPPQACRQRFLWDGGHIYLTVIIHSETIMEQELFLMFTRWNTGGIEGAADATRSDAG